MTTTQHPHPALVAHPERWCTCGHLTYDGGQRRGCPVCGGDGRDGSGA